MISRVLFFLFIGHLLLPLSLQAATPPFPDMNGVWFSHARSIEALKKDGIVSGHPDGTFKPYDPINRAELLKLVFKGRKVTRPKRRCFRDVPVEAWYAPYVCTAKNRDIVGGYPDKSYRPAKTLNYAEAIKIILRAYGRDIEDLPGERWYQNYIDELDTKKILRAHNYLPWAELDRVHAADLIWRVLQYEETSVLHNLSVGCGKATPGTTPTSIWINGEERKFILNIPRTYVPHDPVPLIVAFHGRTNNNAQVRSYYQFDKYATDYITVYPAARKNGNSFTWAGGTNGADIELFDAIVKLLSDKYCIDMDRIYTAGHSLGGWMANAVACARGDVVRGSASLGSSGISGECAGPAAAMIIHNPNDRLASFSGSEQVRIKRAEVNSCSWDLTPTSASALNCELHTKCMGGNDLVWCPHTQNNDHRGEYYPHNWPRTTAKYMTEFFESLD